MSTRSKQRKTAELRSVTGTSKELVHAAASCMHAEGKRESSKLMLEVFDKSPTRPKRVKAAWEGEKSGVGALCPMTPEKALNLIVQMKLSTAQYKSLRENAIEHNAGPLYPSYNVIKEAKKECYPSEESITVTEFSAVIRLQDLLDHIVSRLLKVLEPVMLTSSTEQLQKVVLFYKWGSDSSSGFSEHKQKKENQEFTDSTLYATSIVPLQMFILDSDGSKVLLWQNPRPSSPRYCRPLKLVFMKETTLNIVNESRSVEAEISGLAPSISVLSTGQEVQVKHQMFMTMVDGKVINALTSTKSTQTCYVCGAKPSQINQLEVVEKLHIDRDTFKYGLSVLHATIRSFEYILHVSYKLKVKKWQCRNEQEKISVETRKREIQKAFKEQMGLSVDMPKQGFGSSNDGNTARTFFKNEMATAAITGVSEDLIHRFSIILETLSCGFEINDVAFEKYAMDTCKMCLCLYPWSIMPPTVHKILVHGAAIIRASPLPIGVLTEDALESRHKDCKHYRVFNTRKTSRTECNRDLINMCLITSDPLITSMRRIPQKKKGALREETRQLLCEPKL